MARPGEGKRGGQSPDAASGDYELHTPKLSGRQTVGKPPWKGNARAGVTPKPSSECFSRGGSIHGPLANGSGSLGRDPNGDSSQPRHQSSGTVPTRAEAVDPFAEPPLIKPDDDPARHD